MYFQFTKCELFLGFILLEIYKNVGENTKDKSASNGGDGYLTDAEHKAADTCNQDNGNREEIAVIAKVNLLNHLQTGYCDKAVQREANTAHDTARNGCKQSYKRSEECGNDADDGCAENGNDRCVSGDCNTANRLTIGRIGATAEECANHGAANTTNATGT